MDKLDEILINIEQCNIDIETGKKQIIKFFEKDAEGYICPCCGSDKTYLTDAYHCTRCATTTEI